MKDEPATSRTTERWNIVAAVERENVPPEATGSNPMNTTEQTARNCLASLQHNIKAMQQTKTSPSFVQVLVGFQMAAAAIESLLTGRSDTE